MHDAPRRLLALAIAVVLASALYAVVFYRAGDGYGLTDLVLRKPLPTASTVGPGNGPFTLSDGPSLGLGDTELMSRLSDEYARLVGAVRPSVVSINTTRRTTVQGRPQFHPVLGVTQNELIREEPGLGSGLIVTEEGHILTNYHVIEDVNEIEVTTGDKRTYRADVVGTAPARDIAVLKIRGEEGEVFAALPFGDSSKVRVGEIVFAVGNPFGLGETITRGIISSLPRQVSETGYNTFQTDAVINPGSSGGPLVNTRGEVIAINNLILNPRGGSPSWQGVGFAIPSNDVMEAFERIMSGTPMPVGFLGVRTRNLSAGDRIGAGILDGRGVIVLGIAPSSPGEAAGLDVGDIIRSFAGRQVTTGQELIKMIEKQPVGSEVELEVLRNRQLGRVVATIGDKAKYLEEAKTKISGVIAVALKNPSIYQRNALGLSPEDPGILVMDVSPASPLHGKLAPGDVIFQLNDSFVFDSQKFFRDIDALPFDSKAELHFLRNGLPHTVGFTPVKGEG